MTGKIPRSIKSLAAVTGIIAAAFAGLTAAHAQAVTEHVISRDHVNLVRIVGERITDVVYDSDALEVEADKTRGTVFIRVKPTWLSLGNTKTSAFVNTATGSTGVTFNVEPVESRVIDLRETPTVESVQTRENTAELLAVPLVRFTDSDYVTELKTLVKSAVLRHFDAVADTGTVYSQKAERKAVALTFAQKKGGFGALSVTQKEAWLTADKVIEVLRTSNFAVKPVTINPALFAKAAPGTLAFASDKTELAAGESARIVVIRDRRAALSASVAAGAKGLMLTADALTHLENHAVK